MKTIVSTLFALFCSLTIIAQHAPDELIVQYVEDATEADRIEVRNLYGITDYAEIGGDIELWHNISLPLPVTENGVTVIIESIEELLLNIGIQNGNEENENTANADPRSNVNQGQLNEYFSLPDNGIVYPNGTFDPLPFCDNALNDHLIGPVIQYPNTGGGQANNVDFVDVVIIDQQINSNEVSEIDTQESASNLFDIATGFTSGGDHGYKVFRIIKNQMDQAGITNVRYHNVNTFDANGQSNFARLLRTIYLINGDANQNGTTSKFILNFSANMILSEYDPSSILWTEWQELLASQDMLLVTAAGNQALSQSNDVFPACAGWTHEISVAGTQNCFTAPWNQSNQNSTHFDIATEAKKILTHNGSEYELVNGTSSAAAFVTGALAQLAARCPDYDALELRSHLLANADVVPALNGLVNGGLLLNTTEAVENWETCFVTPPAEGGKSLGIDKPSTLKTTPNPFSATTMVTIQVKDATAAHIKLYNAMGQPVAQEQITLSKGQENLEWETPTGLASGMYLLQVRVGEEVMQQMIMKQ